VIIASDSVELRADGKSHLRTWSVAEARRTFFVDGNDWLDMRRVPATKEILRSTDIRIKFEAYPGHYFGSPVIASRHQSRDPRQSMRAKVRH
jgi:hypothetical protein